MNHRMRNLFALSASLVRMSVRDAASAAELAAIVQERLGALARAHELTMPKDPVADPNESVRLHALLHTILAPYHCSDYDRRLRIVGDDRSEERRVGKECVSTCRSRWSPYH